MNKYTSSDISPINWEEHVRKRPDIYFGSSEVSADEIAKAIEYVAERLGAGETLTLTIDDWCYFCSDTDWMFNSSYEIESIEHVFSNPCFFPEAESPNAFRYEALCTPFSSDVYTRTTDEVVVLKGQFPSKVIVEQHLSKLGNWGRIVGFRYNYNA